MTILGEPSKAFQLTTRHLDVTILTATAVELANAITHENAAKNEAIFSKALIFKNNFTT